MMRDNFFSNNANRIHRYLTVGIAGCTAAVTEPVLLFFFRIGGFVRLSLLDEHRLLGSLFSSSSTRLLIVSASLHVFAILCSKAVVDDVLKRPRARRFSP